MTISIQDFQEEYITPVLEKYKDHPDYILTLENGDELFDVQKVMLVESDVFSPLTNEKGKVYGFSVGEFPFRFMDARCPDDVPLAVMDSIRNYVKNEGETTQIISYVGCNEIFLEGSEAHEEYSLNNPDDKIFRRFLS